MKPPILVNLRKVAEVLTVHEKTVYKLIRSNGFPKPFKLGTASRWDLEEVYEWIRSRRQSAAM